MMLEPFEDRYRTLRGGLFLAAMHGEGNGVLCGERSGGCRLVQFGHRLAEPPAYGVEQDRYSRSILPPDPANCTAFLAGECQRARRRADVLVCQNLSSPQLDWAMAASKCFLDAGGDLIELNAHGAYARYLELGKLRAMILPENQPELVRWVEAFTAAAIPLIVKVDGRQERPAVLQAINKIGDFALFGLHVNVRDETIKQPDFEFARQIRQHYAGFLLVSGYVRSAADARGLFDAGVDMVGIAEPVLSDPDYIGKIARDLGEQRA